MKIAVLLGLALSCFCSALVPTAACAEDWSAWATTSTADGVDFRYRYESNDYLGIQWHSRYQRAVSWQFRLCYTDNWCYDGWVQGVGPDKTEAQGNYHPGTHGRLVTWTAWGVVPYPLTQAPSSKVPAVERKNQVFSNGDRYEGEYRDGRMNGRGTYHFANGNRYEGEFRDGIFNGHGTWTSADGTRREAEYRDGKEISSTADTSQEDPLPTATTTSRPGYGGGNGPVVGPAIQGETGGPPRSTPHGRAGSAR